MVVAASVAGAVAEFRVDKAKIAQSVLNRPSPASSVELAKYRARFALDRNSQLLKPEEAQTLSECTLSSEILKNWEQWRVFVGRSAIRTMGLVDYQLQSFSYWLRYELTRLQRTMKSWSIASGCRVHRFRIVKVYVVPPTVIADEHEEQCLNLSPHEARLSNSPYEGTFVVDIHQRTYCHPNGFLPSQQKGPSTAVDNKADTSVPSAPTTGAGRFQLPAGWESWPLESEEIHLRKPLHRFGVMHMSMADKRTTGTLRPENFVYEDLLDEGGWFSCANSSVFSPAHETLRHNHSFLFPAGGSNFATANDACETPDEKEPFEVRQAKAAVGAQIHMNKAHKLEIRCIHPTRRQRSTSTIVIRMSKYKRTDKFGGQNLTVQMQFLSVSLPPTVLFMALGFSVDQGIEMMKHVAGMGVHWYGAAFDPILRKMRARHPPEVVTQADACIYIADRAEKENCPLERKMLYANSFLENEFFPQIGLSLSYAANKALYLAYVLWKLLMKSVGYGFYDSKDTYYVQRYDTPGVLWSSLQRQISYKIHTATDRALRSVLQSQLPFNWRQIFGEQKVSDQIACCLSKGSWSVNRYMTGSSRTGATLALKNTNYFGYASCVRRSNTPNKAHRRSINARQIAEDQIGRRCAVETPEGEMCGIASFQAVGSTLSVPSSNKVLLGLLREVVPKHLWTDAAKSCRSSPAPIKGPNDYWMELDGGLQWRTTEEGALYIVSAVRRLRRAGLISPHISVHIDSKAVLIGTAPGRNVRLLIVLSRWLQWMRSKHQQNNIVTEASPVKQWFLPLNEALRLGILEHVDAMEERALSIAFSFEDFLRRSCHGERFSHMEVDPSWMLGVTAGALPHSDHNQSPRSVLGSAMSKQTFSGVINPFRLMMTAHILEYPQRPLCQNRIFDDLQLKGLCMGQMVDFVIAATDHTMEDSWEYSQAAHDRGLHKTSLLRRYVSNNKPIQSSNTGKVERVERFKKPGPDCLGLQDANYNKIGLDGLPVPGTLVEPEDIIIGRTYRDTKSMGMPSREEIAPEWADSAAPGIFDSSNMEHDDSVSVRDERGVVQSVRSIISENGAYHIKEVILRTSCMNEIGDKYFCRHGQKGTTGLNRPEWDMLFSIVSGKAAQCHMNPIGILARMTHGHLLELYKSTAAAIVGQYVIATPFLTKAQKEREVDVVAALLSVGAQKLAYETHINGMTGELTRPLLRGVIFQSALAHLVGSKIHARNRGPRKVLTRQPDDGRSKHGGLRFGQMEVDCFAALGAAHFLVERLKTTSDEFILPVCGKCGMIAEYSRETGYRFCRPCFDGDEVYTVSVSYSSKLFIQELLALHIRAQFILGDNDIDPHVARSVAPKGELKPVAADLLAPTSMCEFLNVAKPEWWEFASLNIPQPPDLRNEIEELTGRLEKVQITEPKPSKPASASASASTSTSVRPMIAPAASKARKPRTLFSSNNNNS
jgi:DNA-directed RNA polymerase II subunit RPB2